MKRAPPWEESWILVRLCCWIGLHTNLYPLYPLRASLLICKVKHWYLIAVTLWVWKWDKIFVLVTWNNIVAKLSSTFNWMIGNKQLSFRVSFELIELCFLFYRLGPGSIYNKTLWWKGEQIMARVYPVY